jgi:predicted alpha/beta-fold hydrolase
MLRSARLQTILGSLRLRRYSRSRVLASGRHMELSTASGARLTGALSVDETGGHRALMILLHGWEGSINSTYLLSAADYFFNNGLDVFRLNLRDHGGSHNLNPGLFYATLLQETYEAILQAARLAGPAPVFLCGFSLGGNFALRVARRFSQTPEYGINLQHIFAVSPVLDPSRTTDAIDSHRLLRHYFVNKWQRSLRIKQRCFPELYDFAPVAGLTRLRQMTELLLNRYSSFRCAQDYFDEYTLCAHALENISLPTTIVTAADDPIIPVDDFDKLHLSPQTDLIIHPYGGHNGFLTGLRTGRWYESFITNFVKEKRNAA